MMYVPKDRKSLFRQFLAGMYDAVVITDPNGHIIEVNNRALEFFGHTVEKLADQPISMLIPGLKQEVVVRIRKNIESDHHVVVDVNGVSASGAKFACEVTVSPIDLMNPGDLIFTIRNVERRREYMNAFRAMANAFNIAPVALFGCDVEGNIRDCNSAFLDMFGLESVDEARQHVFSDYLGDEPLVEGFKKALAGERVELAISAEGDDDDSHEMNVILAPNFHARKSHGVVGSIERL